MQSVPIQEDTEVIPQDLKAATPASDVTETPSLASAPSEPSTSTFIHRSEMTPGGQHCSDASFQSVYKCSYSEHSQNICKDCDSYTYRGTAGASSTVELARPGNAECIVDEYEVGRQALVFQCPAPFEGSNGVSIGDEMKASNHTVLTILSQVSCR